MRCQSDRPDRRLGDVLVELGFCRSPTLSGQPVKAGAASIACAGAAATAGSGAGAAVVARVVLVVVAIGVVVEVVVGVEAWAPVVMLPIE